MKVSRRRLFAGSIALTGALGISTPFTFQQVDAASAPIGQTIWLQATNNNYASTRTDQTNIPLEALVTQAQAWEEFDVLVDTNVTGQVRSDSQQQWISRNAQLGSWSGSNWNMVFVGVNGAPSQSFPINGNNVTAYGLFVEHYQQYQVIWNGNGGRTYFFQNELPYDPPNQAAWMNGSTNGYAAYKVANSVTSHEAWGLGSYCYFNVNPGVVDDRSFEVPNTSGVKFHDMITVSLGGTGTIAHIINSTGGPSNSSQSAADLVSYP